jgi:hypothetical protein
MRGALSNTAGTLNWRGQVGCIAGSWICKTASWQREHMTIIKAIRSRYSCRIFEKRPIEAQTQRQLAQALQSLRVGPLGSPLRFELAAASEGDQAALRGLGTYGFIRNPAGFIIGAVQEGPRALEDYGYRMEQAILEAARLGLGTCWLGGSFTQSSFAARMGKRADEIIPAVTAAGYAVPDSSARDLIRRQARASSRLPWVRLFFQGAFDHSLNREDAGVAALPLEMARLAPSASNKQPWRVLMQGRDFHFYLERTPNYGQGSLTYTLLRLADLQRVDIGIAMCHFELASQELNLKGTWLEADPKLPLPSERNSYIITWRQA